MGSQTFVELPDDPPAIEVAAGEKTWADMKLYFDDNLACGDLPEDVNNHPWRLGSEPIWSKGRGCGVRNWDVRKTFWYPRPGQQFEITCNNCNRVFGVEVHQPI